MFWKLIFIISLAGFLFSLYVLVNIEELVVRDYINILLSTIGILPIYGLAFNKKILTQDTWKIYFIVAFCFTLYTIYATWIPIITQNSLTFFLKTFLLGGILMFIFLYGQLKYSFLKTTVWSK